MIFQARPCYLLPLWSCTENFSLEPAYLNFLIYKGKIRQDLSIRSGFQANKVYKELKQDACKTIKHT